MIARTLLALMLCPFLGALSGSWLVHKVMGWLATGRLRLPFVLDPAYGVLAGLGVGMVLAGIMIWCFSRGSRTPQRALADLIIIPMAIIALVDAFHLTETTWAVTAVAWLLGLVLCLIAVRTYRSAGQRALPEEPEEEPDAAPVPPEDEYL